MFIDRTMGPRIAAGQCPVRRAVFLKPRGIAKADFIVTPGLPSKYQISIFSLKKFDEWVRFSSDTVPSAPDLKTTVGIGIKLFNVPGNKILEEDENAVTAIFFVKEYECVFC